MIFNAEIANDLLEKKLIRKQIHPELPLIIWNYSEKAQYAKSWDEFPVLLHLRGLITDENFNIIARPFKKFFNVEENRHKESEYYDIYSKLDGSLGIIFYYEGQWLMATRGSFTSEQSVVGSKLMQPYLTDFDPDCTYLVEIIYRNGRIVITYPFEDIVLLGIIHKSGMEYDIHKYMKHSLIRKCPIVGDNRTPLSVLKEHIPDDEEGYVIKFRNGDRCKIKGVNYLRLHRLMTDITSYSIWENLKNGADILELLNDIPDEMFAEIDHFVKTLTLKFIAKLHMIQTAAKAYLRDYPIRKDLAIALKNNEDAGLIFTAIDKSVEILKEKIWLNLKPKYYKF